MSHQALQQLVLIKSSQTENAYGRFTAEILRSEGFTGFRTLDLDHEDYQLRQGDLAVLTRCFLTVPQMDSLREQVRQGAALICLQPSVAMAERFGWRTTCRVQYPGWVRWNKSNWLDQPIQAHVPIAGYTPSDETDARETVAEAAQPDGSPAGFPAVVLQRVGKGRVALFFYDPAAAMARIRFGDPELVSLLTTGSFASPHAADLFAHQLDARVMHLPQADLHAQLLASTLNQVCSYPLPRLWYYPRADQRSAAVFQSDGDGSSPQEFDALAGALEQRGATATFYLMKDTRLDGKRMAAMQHAGHTFGPHVNYQPRQDEVYYSYPEALALETDQFDRRYGGHSPTLQAHCAPWMGYMDWVPMHIRHAYRLLFAYLSLPAQRFCRFMCGSGRPLRFCDRNGGVYDCRQQPVMVYDDSSMQAYLTAHPQAALADFSAILQPALNHHHTAFGILSHPLSFHQYSRPFMEGVLDAIREAGMPVFNGDQWLRFHDRRDGAILEHEIENDILRFRLTGARGEITVLIPGTGRLRAVTGRIGKVQQVCRFGEQYQAVAIDGDGSELCIETEGAKQ